MAAIDKDKKLLAPLIDRLSGEGKTVQNIPSHQILRQLRESIRRDLENLFNTRYRCFSPSERHVHLRSSLVNFGLPDISTVNLVDPSSRQRFCRDVEEAILTFEPRIKSVQVFGDQSVDREDPTIRFRIEAKLHANPLPETMVFDSALNPVNHNINVSEIA
ncbi:MAG: type VI secretion system protein ImpF [Oceanicoccus sp.]|jgi:type VI secretion system protein ImpF